VKRVQLPTLINTTLKDANGNPLNVTLSMVPAIRELDAIHYYGSGWPWPVPLKPLHGDHCNVLFFDWHVGQVSPTEYK
jgi:prepilin-type processing-associated H-X9-DG protein